MDILEAKQIDQNVTAVNVHDTYNYLYTVRSDCARWRTLLGSWNSPDWETCKHCYGLRSEAV